MRLSAAVAQSTATSPGFRTSLRGLNVNRRFRCPSSGSVSSSLTAIFLPAATTCSLTDVNWKSGSNARMRMRSSVVDGQMRFTLLRFENLDFRSEIRNYVDVVVDRQIIGFVLLVQKPQTIRLPYRLTSIGRQQQRESALRALIGQRIATRLIVGSKILRHGNRVPHRSRRRYRSCPHQIQCTTTKWVRSSKR